MSIELQAYTTEGLLSGQVVADGRLLDLLSTFETIVLDNAMLAPIGGLPQRATGWTTVEVDDLLVVVAPPETVTPYHAAWHRLMVDCGPYRIRGELPSLPGFDPGRALARPSGSFILIGRGVVELRDEEFGRVLNPHAYLWLNRYAVDAVSSDLDLNFFFPGAISEAAQRAIAG
jgi:hypothetical protein